MRQHVVAHMGEDQPLRPNFSEMLLKQSQRHVPGDRLVARIGFTDEQVGVAADLDQRFRPLRIAGESDDLAFGFEAEAETGPGAVVMHDVKGGDVEISDRAALADLQFLQRHRKRPLHGLRSRKGDIHDLTVARLQARRPDNSEVVLAFEDIIRIEDEERQSADMIGVKVRDEDGVDVVWIDRELVHGDKRRRAAIDQGVDLLADQMKARIGSSARAEGVAAADELQMHGASYEISTGAAIPLSGLARRVLLSVSP